MIKLKKTNQKKHIKVQQGEELTDIIIEDFLQNNTLIRDQMQRQNIFNSHCHQCHNSTPVY